MRGQNGRRHEVDFGDAPLRVETYASDETIEIFVEADFDTYAEEFTCEAWRRGIFWFLLFCAQQTATLLS
jgi:hypothetical protein